MCFFGIPKAKHLPLPLSKKKSMPIPKGYCKKSCNKFNYKYGKETTYSDGCCECTCHD